MFTEVSLVFTLKKKLTKEKQTCKKHSQNPLKNMPQFKTAEFYK